MHISINVTYPQINSVSQVLRQLGVILYITVKTTGYNCDRIYILSCTLVPIKSTRYNHIIQFVAHAHPNSPMIETSNITYDTCRVIKKQLIKLLAILFLYIPGWLCL